MTTTLTVATNQAIEPQNMAELVRLAKAVSAARLGNNVSEDQALVLMMTGRDLGLSYAQSMRAFHMVSGKPVLSADAMVAVCLRSGKCEFFETIETTNERCTVEACRKGRKPVRFTFTIDDAKKAGLLNNPTWSKYPAAMLKARAKSALARDMFPDLLMGLYDPDEVDSTPAPQQVVVEAVPASAPTPVSPPIVEPTAEEREELFEILKNGLLKCQTVEALRDFGESDIRPKAPGLGKRLRGKLQDVYRMHNEVLLAKDALAKEELVQEEPGALG